MTINPSTGDSPLVPEWDLADRMQKSLRLSGLGVSEMAEILGVGRDTIGRWINGRGTPKRAALLAWAAITNVAMHWLEDGCSIEHPSEKDLRACRDSNPKPSDLESGPARPRHLSIVRATLTPDRRVEPAWTGHLVSVS